jgi:hypothetical protein
MSGFFSHSTQLERNGEDSLMRSGNEQHGVAMPRLLLLTGVILLTADYSFAQYSPDPTPMQCQLIRLAVAQYGFAAARQHALETYGPEAVKTGDKCFPKGRARHYAPTAAPTNAAK